MLHNIGYTSCDPENRYKFECQVEKDNIEESFHPIISELDKNVVFLLINYIVQISNHFFLLRDTVLASRRRYSTMSRCFLMCFCSRYDLSAVQVLLLGYPG